MDNPTWHIPDPHAQPEFYADVPTKRLIAWIVDMVLILGISALITVFTAFVGLLFFPLIVLTVGFVYRVVTIANGSATWGMRLLAIEFRTLRGERFDLSMAAMHTFFYSVSLAFFLMQIISMVLMLTTARCQWLSDHLLGTVAVNRRAGS